MERRDRCGRPVPAPGTSQEGGSGRRRSPWWTLWTGLGAAGCPQVHPGRGLRLKKRRPKPPFRLWTVFFHPFIGQQFYFHPGKRDFCEIRDDLRDFSAGRCSFSVEISNPLVVRHLFPAIPVFQCILSYRHRHNTLPFDQRLPPRSPGPLAHRVKGVKNERSDPLTHASIMGRAGEANGGGFFRPEGIRRAGRVRAGVSLVGAAPARLDRKARCRCDRRCVVTGDCRMVK